MIRKVVTSMIALLFVLTLFTPVFADDGVTTTQVEETQAFCESGKTHPAIAKLAHTFGLEYELVLGWFCQGHDLDAIKDALREAAMTDQTVEEILGIEIEVVEECVITEEEDCIEENVPEECVITDEEDCVDDEPNCVIVDGEEVCEESPEELEDFKNSIYCRDEDVKQHPTGLKYSELYEGASYETIMEWFCSGYGFGQIKHALNTGGIDGAGGVLKLRDTMGWGEIWKIDGKPAKIHPVFGQNWKKANPPQEEGEPVVMSPNVKGKPAKPGK